MLTFFGSLHRTMARSAVALTYDIIAVPVSAHKHDAEERRVNCIGIVKIMDSKLAQSDIVRFLMGIERTTQG